MMKIPKEKKAQLNKLISYYRHLYSKDNERFLPKNFIYDEEGLTICTVYTLSRIENNKTLSYDNIYLSLLDNLGIDYIYEPKIDKLLHMINLSILKCAEINNAKSIVEKINKTTNTLSRYLDYAFYKEQAEIYQIILDYYAEYKFNTELIDKYNQLFDLVDEPLKPVLIEIFSIYYTRIHLDADKALMALKLVENCKSNSIMIDYLYVALCFREYKLLKEKELAEKLVVKCKSENNNFYLCKTYNILASLYTQQNPDLSMEYLKKAIDHFDQEKDDKHNLAIYTRNLGILASMNNLHELAVEYFDLLYKTDREIILITFPYYIYSLERISFKRSYIKDILFYLLDNKANITDNIFLALVDFLFIKYEIISVQNIEKAILLLYEEEKRLKKIKAILDIIEVELYDICLKYDCFSIYKDFMKIFH
ncbi:MAG: tetratricopeptide repeat protein [Erysipelotrichia bacterium]|nr:tetratricopeptide repeat protein [Erysipelotrichia bacterium]NCC54439.1 tetratricopeptide repeat protein [Erysipelotrichia bacterium]